MALRISETSIGLPGCGMRVTMEARCGIKIFRRECDLLFSTGGVRNSHNIDGGMWKENHRLGALRKELTITSRDRNNLNILS